MSKKIISFSLWGDNPKYCEGAIRNASIRSKFYPDWICRFYVHKNVKPQYINQLCSFKNVEVCIENRPADWTGMFWRFEAISDPDVSIVISRDCDSRLNQREAEAVEEFEKSDKKFHIMRDHPHHGFNVLGGMFGIKKGLLDNMKDLCENFQKKDSYGTDYNFFDKLINIIPKESIMIHDPFFSGKNFPSSRCNYQFVGQVFDENDNTVQAHTDALKKYINENSNIIHR